MRVNDVGWLGAENFQRRPAKEDEALGIVGIIFGRCAVEKLAVEVFIGADEIDGD